MENYIVRIYRRDNSDPERINGVLESIEQETQRPFASLNTLKNMLATSPEALKAESASSDNNTQPTLALAK
jgi:hypothetical protein